MKHPNENVPPKIDLLHPNALSSAQAAINEVKPSLTATYFASYHEPQASDNGSWIPSPDDSTLDADILPIVAPFYLPKRETTKSDNDSYLFSVNFIDLVKEIRGISELKVKWYDFYIVVNLDNKWQLFGYEDISDEDYSPDPNTPEVDTWLDEKFDVYCNYSHDAKYLPLIHDAIESQRARIAVQQHFDGIFVVVAIDAS